MHAAYTIGASHQVAGAPDVAKPTPHPDRGHRRRCDHFRCYRCLQRRQSGVRLVQPQLESALVIAEWPASRPEPHAIRLAAGSAIGPVAAARALHDRHSAGLDCHGRLACAEAMRTAIMGSPFAPLTPHFIWHISRQLAGAPDVAKPTPHPDRGHRRRYDHFRCYRCLQRRQSGVRLVQPQLESALVIAEWPASKPEPLRCGWQRHLPCSSCQEHRMAGTAGLDCHGRLACAEAMRAAIVGGPFASLALHFI